MTTKRALLFATVLLIPLWAYALKTWTTGETIKATDLNSNFSTVNTAANALVTDAKVSSSAAISHSKLATPALVPKAWAQVAPACAAGTCTISSGTGFSSIAYAGAGTGRYTVTFTTTRANTSYAPFVTTVGTNGNCTVEGGTLLTTSFVVACYDATGSALSLTGSMAFHVLVMDDN